MPLPLLALALGGSLASGIGSIFGARAQSQAADRQLEYAQQLQPWMRSGRQSNNALMYLMGFGDKPQGFRGFEASPGFQYALDQGQSAIQGSAAARGNLLSGATLKALQANGTGLAQQEYGNFLSRLGNMSSMGAGATTNFAQIAGGAAADRGNAVSAGWTGVGNAVNDGIGNYLSAWGYQNGVQPTQPGAGV